jgi:hypothetical protein
MVLRIEALEVHVIFEPLATGLEDILQDARIEEERRADVEGVAPRRANGAGATAHRRLALEDRDRHAFPGEEHGGGKASRPCADDGDTGRWVEIRHEAAALARPGWKRNGTQLDQALGKTRGQSRFSS